MTISNKGILNLNDTNIDEKDRHVVTTAICSNAQVIVTYNIKDFQLKPKHQTYFLQIF